MVFCHYRLLVDVLLHRYIRMLKFCNENIINLPSELCASSCYLAAICAAHRFMPLLLVFHAVLLFSFIPFIVLVTSGVVNYVYSVSAMVFGLFLPFSRWWGGNLRLQVRMRYSYV